MVKVKIVLSAVTLVLSIAVAGWAMGLVGGFGRIEALRIFPESTLKTDRNFMIVVGNVGSGDARITGIRIGNVDYSNSSYPVVVAAGGKTVLTGRLGSGTFISRVPYEAHVYTAIGNDYMITFTAS